MYGINLDSLILQVYCESILQNFFQQSDIAKWGGMARDAPIIKKASNLGKLWKDHGQVRETVLKEI